MLIYTHIHTHKFANSLVVNINESELNLGFLALGVKFPSDQRIKSKLLAKLAKLANSRAHRLASRAVNVDNSQPTEHSVPPTCL